MADNSSERKKDSNCERRVFEKQPLAVIQPFQVTKKQGKAKMKKTQLVIIFK